MNGKIVKIIVQVVAVVVEYLLTEKCGKQKPEERRR